MSKQLLQSCFQYNGTSVTFSEPASEQCEKNEVIAVDEETKRVAFAAWHPQWGGYVGKCIVETARGGGECFEVHNWHDGEFPVDTPRTLHYCDPDQLVRFGEKVKSMQADAK